MTKNNNNSFYNKDYRLDDFYTLENNNGTKAYTNVIDAHPYPYLPEIINWLKQLTNLRVVRNTLVNQTFENALDSNPHIYELISKGDIHYVQIFHTHNLFPTHVLITDDIQPVFSFCRQVYEYLTQTAATEDITYTVCRHLHEHFYHLLSQSIAIDDEFNTFEHWYNLIELYHEHSFIKNFILKLPITKILTCKKELAHIAAVSYKIDLRFADQPSSWDINLTLYKDDQLPLWDNLSRIIQESKQGGSNEKLWFKSILISRLTPEEIANWIDQLGFPMIQSIILNEIDDLKLLEELIVIFCKCSNHLTSPLGALILMAMDHFWHLALEISRNLTHLQTASSHHNPSFSNHINEQATLDLDHWLSVELKEHLDKILFSIVHASKNGQSKLLSIILDWIGYQGKINWSGNQFESVMNTCNEELHNSFINQFADNSIQFSYLLAIIEDNQLNHTTIKLLTILSDTLKADNSSINILSDRLVKFTASNDFPWNHYTQYNNETILQADCLAVLLFHAGNSIEKYKAIASDFRIHHQGWYNKRSSNKIFSYNYILTAGLALSRRYYKDGDKTTGADLFEFIIHLTISQYRNANSCDASGYLIPLYFACNVMMDNTPDDIELYFNKITTAIDDTLDYIKFCRIFIRTSRAFNRTLSDHIKETIKLKIKTSGWILDAKEQSLKSSGEFAILKKAQEEILLI